MKESFSRKLIKRLNSTESTRIEIFMHEIVLIIIVLIIIIIISSLFGKDIE